MYRFLKTSWSLFFLLFISCNTFENNEKELESKVDSAFQVFDGINLRNSMDSFHYEFISATPSEKNSSIININIPHVDFSWEDYVFKKYKPKTAQNKIGFDTSTLIYGDFGNLIFNSPIIFTDSFHYYAINNNKVEKLRVDSANASIMYQKEGNPSFFGNLLGYSGINIYPVSFAIRTKDENLINKIRFTSISKNDLVITDSNLKNEKEKISGPYILNYTIRDKTFTCFTEESKINYKQTHLIQISEGDSYLLVSWLESSSLCKYFFSIYSFSDCKLIEVNFSAYNCDI